MIRIVDFHCALVQKSLENSTLPSSTPLFAGEITLMSLVNEEAIFRVHTDSKATFRSRPDKGVIAPFATQKIGVKIL